MGRLREGGAGSRNEGGREGGGEGSARQLADGFKGSERARLRDGGKRKEGRSGRTLLPEIEDPVIGVLVAVERADAHEELVGDLPCGVGGTTGRERGRGGAGEGGKAASIGEVQQSERRGRKVRKGAGPTVPTGVKPYRIALSTFDVPTSLPFPSPSAPALAAVTSSLASSRPSSTRSWTAAERRRRVPNSEKKMLALRRVRPLRLAVSTEERGGRSQAMREGGGNKGGWEWGPHP